jgi:hypothetical protein
VTNPGDVPLVGSTVAPADADCDAAPVLRDKGGDPTADTLDPGDVWTYTCTKATTRRAGRAATTVLNHATVTGADADGVSVAAAADAKTLIVTGDVKHEEASGGKLPQARAVIHGPATCVRQVFGVRVSGVRIRRVTFRIDGHVVQRLSGQRRHYVLRVHPGGFGLGLHRVRATVRFTAGARQRTLRMAFQACRPPVIVPPFTG